MYLLGVFAIRYFPFNPTYPYYSTLTPFAPDWLARWAGFDGVHYVSIIQNGYFGWGLIQAFFPVYPLLVRALNVIHNPVITGLITTIVFLFLFMVLFAKKAVEDQPDSKTSQRMLTGLLLSVFTFPTAFFLLGFYTESLFLFLVLSTFYFSEKKQWLWAGIFAGIASGTRIVGICLFPALVLQAYYQHKKSGAAGFPWKQWGCSLLSFVGLISYMIYLNHTYHDPLYFLHVQHAFGGGRQENLIIFPQVLYRYLKIILTVSPTTWAYYASVQELLMTIEVGLFLAWATLKSRVLERPALLFSWLAYFIPPLTGTFSSMPRYVLVLFPIHLLFAKLYVKYPRRMGLLFLLHGILLVVNVLLFFQGKWVA